MRRIPLLLVAVISACGLVSGAAAGGLGFRLAVVNADGTHRQRLMNDIQIDLFDFSPDRRQVVFARACGSFCKSGLYVSNPNETKARRILATQAQIFPAFWSPDGKRIAFGVLGRLNDATVCGQSVWTIRNDGTDLHLVSDCALLPESSGTNDQPWAPDSSRLVFLAHVQPPKAFAANLAIANVDGTGRRDFSSLVHVGDAAWAPRGERIALTTPGATQGFSQLRVIDASSGVVTPLGQGSSPTWSHNGRQLAFVDGSVYYRRRAYVGTVLFGRNGARRRRLRATYVVGGRLISWTPSDRVLTFVGCRRSRFCKQPEVFSIRTDGIRLRQVTNEHDIATVEFEGIWWSPNGRRLFFSRFRLGA